MPLPDLRSHLGGVKMFEGGFQVTTSLIDGAINIISGGAMDGDSNIARKVHNCWMENFAIGIRPRLVDNLSLVLGYQTWRI